MRRLISFIPAGGHCFNQLGCHRDRDAIPKGNKTLLVNLAAGVGYGIGALSNTTVQILDGDAPIHSPLNNQSLLSR